MAIAFLVSPTRSLTTRSSPTPTAELRGVWLTNFGGAALFFPQGVNKSHVPA